MSGTSRVSRSPTLMPKGETSTRCDRRRQHFTAISAAIHPPIDDPTRTTSLRFEPIEEIEIEVAEIVDAIDPGRQRRAAESRMRRRDDAAAAREKRVKRRLGPKLLDAVENDNRPPGAALGQIEGDIVYSREGRPASHGASSSTSPSQDHMAVSGLVQAGGGVVQMERRDVAFRHGIGQ